MKYTKRLEIIEAIQWNGNNFENIELFCNNILINVLEGSDNSICLHNEDNTTSSAVVIKKNDWIVKDSTNTFHVYNSTKFNSTFIEWKTNE